MLLGLHAGDGWVSDEWGLALARNDRTMLREVVSLCRNVLGVEPFISQKVDYSVSIRSGQPQVKAFFIHYGFPRGKKARIVRVPRAILETEDIGVVRSFLKGLFSADGCFSHRRRQASCVLSVSSLDLRDGFINLSAKIGFNFHAYSYTHTYGHNKVPLNLAYLGRKSEVFRWMTEVGSMKDSHIAKFHEWEKLLS